MELVRSTFKQHTPGDPASIIKIEFTLDTSHEQNMPKELTDKLVAFKNYMDYVLHRYALLIKASSLAAWNKIKMGTTNQSEYELWVDFIKECHNQLLAQTGTRIQSIADFKPKGT